MNKRKTLKSVFAAIFIVAICAIGIFSLTSCGECEEHTFRIEPRTATCEEGGMVFRFCEVCGYNDEVESPALGHKYDEWQVMTEATCQHEGYQTRYCGQCHGEEAEEIPMLPHKTETWTVDTDPTETEKGLAKANCTVCEHTCTTELPALNETDYKIEVVDSETKLYSYTIDNSDVEIYVSNYQFFEVYDYVADKLLGYKIRAGKEITTEKLVLPSTYKGMPIVKIMEDGFWGSYIKEIVIPEGVTSIEDDAFISCENLEKITLPSTIKSIGDPSVSYLEGGAAFPSFNDLYYNGTVESWCNVKLNKYANPMANGENFYILNANNEYELLTEITIPDTVTAIPDEQFQGFKSLTTVNFHNNLTSIGKSAFSSSGLTSIVIPNSVTSIGEHAFYNTALSSVSLPNGIKNIAYGAFANCNNLESISIPSSVTYIEGNAFYECENLATVEIKIDSQLAKIGKNAFYNCYKITSLLLPATLEYVGSYPISSFCSTIYYMGNATAFDYIEGKQYITFDDSTIYYYSEKIPMDYTYEYWYVDENNEIAIWELGSFVKDKVFVYSYTETQVSDAYWEMLKAVEAQGMLEMVFSSIQLGEEVAKRQIEMIVSSSTKEEYERKLCEFSSETGENTSYKFEDGKVTVSINGVLQSSYKYVEYENAIYLANGTIICYVDPENNCIYELNETEYASAWHYFEIVND